MTSSPPDDPGGSSVNLADGLRGSLTFPDPASALASTTFIESDHPALRSLVTQLNRAHPSSVDRAVAAFRFVRDNIAYEFRAKLRPEEYRAAYVLQRKTGFCVQKAVLFVAVLRALNIPSALVLVDLKDRTIPQRISRAMGTDVMIGHGLAAVYLDGVWMLVDPTHDAVFAARKRYRVVEWSGVSDALMAATTEEGEPHAEYISTHGVFLDLPLAHLFRLFATAYGAVDVALLKAAGVDMNPLDVADFAALVDR